MSLEPDNKQSEAQAATEGLAGSARRDELLREILQWLGEVGAINFSLRGAAEACGVSAPTLLRHFGSRDGLLDAMVYAHQHTSIEQMRQGWRQAGSYTEGLRRALRARVILPLDQLRVYQQISAVMYSAPERWGAHQRLRLQELVDVQVEAMLEEGVPVAAARDIAQLLSAGAAGIVQLYLVFQDEAQLQRSYHQLYEAVIERVAQALRTKAARNKSRRG